MKKNQHVVPTSDGWGIRGANNSRLTSKHDTKAEAVSVARQIAITKKSELIIHGQDGKIQRSNSYGNDPCPPKDSK
jgi:hypothetical protein